MRTDSRKKHYIIAVQWHGKTIGGMAQRFIRCADYLIASGEDILCISSRSLAQHMNVSPGNGLILIDDASRLRLLHELLVASSLLFNVLLGKVESIHYAGGGRIERALFRLLSRMGVRTSVTFASRTLAMAAYGDPRKEKIWRSLLDSAVKIDVLNPGHELTEWSEKVYVSPCSFPARLTGDQRAGFDEYRSCAKERLILFAGAFVGTKNPLLAMEGFREFAESTVEGRKWKLCMIGRGPLFRRLKDRSFEINEELGRRAIHFGEESEIFQNLRRARVFLSLQDHDNYPSQSLMEAMLYGCHIVATSDGDTPLMFSECEGNHIIRWKDSGLVAAALAHASAQEPVNVSNQRMIEQHHTLKRFSHYFSDFLKR